MKFINRYILLALAFVAPFFAMEKKPGLCGDQYYQDWSERVEESRKKFEIYLKQKEAKKDTKRREKEEISLNNVVPQYMEPQKNGTSACSFNKFHGYVAWIDIKSIRINIKS